MSRNEQMSFGEKLGTVLLLAALMLGAILATGCQPLSEDAKPFGYRYKRAPMYWSYEANAWRTAPEVRVR